MCVCHAVKREGGGEGGVVDTRTHKPSPASKLSISIIMIIIMTTNERHARMKNNDDDVDDVDDVVDVDAATKWKSTKKRLLRLLHFFRNFAFSNFFFSYLRSKFFWPSGSPFFRTIYFILPLCPSPEQPDPTHPLFRCSCRMGFSGRLSIYLEGQKDKSRVITL